MPTDIYIGDIPIEEAYLGDDPIQMDDNNVCRPCYGYTLRKQSFPVDIPPTWVSASNCYNNETFVLNVNSQVTRVYAASEIIEQGPNGVHGSIGALTGGQGQNACKNAYGKEEYLPCESWTFTNTGNSFNYIGYYGCNGQWSQSLLQLPGFAGDTITACIQSGSFISLVSSSYNGPC